MSTDPESRSRVGQWSSITSAAPRTGGAATATAPTGAAGALARRAMRNAASRSGGGMRRSRRSAGAARRRSRVISSCARTSRAWSRLACAAAIAAGTVDGPASEPGGCARAGCARRKRGCPSTHSRLALRYGSCRANGPQSRARRLAAPGIGTAPACSSTASGVQTVRYPQAASRRHRSAPASAAGSAGSTPPTSQNTSRRRATHAAVTAHTPRASASSPNGSSSDSRAPRSRWQGRPAASGVRPASRMRPSASSSLAPTAPTPGRSTWATSAPSQSGRRADMPASSRTSTSPLARMVAARASASATSTSSAGYSVPPCTRAAEARAPAGVVPSPAVTMTETSGGGSGNA